MINAYSIWIYIFFDPYWGIKRIVSLGVCACIGQHCCYYRLRVINTINSIGCCNTDWHLASLVLINCSCYQWLGRIDRGNSRPLWSSWHFICLFLSIAQNRKLGRISDKNNFSNYWPAQTVSSRRCCSKRALLFLQRSVLSFKKFRWNFLWCTITVDIRAAFVW